MTVRRTAVVTGAASGIGAAVCAELVALGTRVVGVDVAPVEQGTVDGVVGDVSAPTTWQAVERRLDEQPDAALATLVTCAGVVVAGALLDLDDAAWERSHAVNVMGAVRALRVCLPRMITAGGGAVVTVASVDAFTVEQNVAAYCASKGALLQLTRAVAVDYAHLGVRANCVCPGVTDTAFFRRNVPSGGVGDELVRKREDRNPIGRLLEPSEVAAVAVFLGSEAASGITGSIVPVDGGLTAGSSHDVVVRPRTSLNPRPTSPPLH